VQRLEEEWASGQVVTLDAMDPRIRAFGEEVDFQVTPTFILFDSQGSEIRRWVGRAPSLEELAVE
jgi:thioredoxin-related protein